MMDVPSPHDHRTSPPVPAQGSPCPASPCAAEHHARIALIGEWRMIDVARLTPLSTYPYGSECFHPVGLDVSNGPGRRKRAIQVIAVPRIRSMSAILRHQPRLPADIH